MDLLHFDLLPPRCLGDATPKTFHSQLGTSIAWSLPRGFVRLAARDSLLQSSPKEWGLHLGDRYWLEDVQMCSKNAPPQSGWLEPMANLMKRESERQRDAVD